MCGFVRACVYVHLCAFVFVFERVCVSVSVFMCV